MKTAVRASRSEGRLSADSEEKLTFASAEIAIPIAACTPLLSGFARLLRCGKYLGQSSEVFVRLRQNTPMSQIGFHQTPMILPIIAFSKMQ